MTPALAVEHVGFSRGWARTVSGGSLDSIQGQSECDTPPVPRTRSTLGGKQLEPPRSDLRRAFPRRTVVARRAFRRRPVPRRRDPGDLDEGRRTRGPRAPFLRDGGGGRTARVRVRGPRGESRAGSAQVHLLGGPPSRRPRRPRPRPRPRPAPRSTSRWMERRPRWTRR